MTSARGDVRKKGDRERLTPKRRLAAKNKRAPAQSETAAIWKLEDAKAKFSEVVRRAHAEGPQYVTVRGEPSVAVIDAIELERLLPPKKPRLPFVRFMESLYVEGLDLSRDADAGRDAEL